MGFRLDNFGDWKATATHHTPLEDAQAILTGVVLVALSLSIFSHLGLVTSGIAGLALIIHYGLGYNIGLVFFLLNLPFYFLALKQLGKAFTLKTFIGVSFLAVLVDLHPLLLNFAGLNILYGTVLAGLLMGFGFLALFRHRTSLGGVGILAFYLQDKFGWRAGIVQLCIDLCIMALAFTVVSWQIVIFSLIGAAVMNLFLAINHRSDRYLAR